MLNEISEYKSYIEQPESDHPRLMPLLLTEGFDSNALKLNGINQTLEIIVRGFLFDPDNEKQFFDDGIITELGIKEIKDHLNEWFGGWFKEFFIFQYKKHKKGSDKQAEEALGKWYKKWDEILNSDKNYAAESINYNMIIASAIEKGPLRERYCAIKKDDALKNINDIKKLCDTIFSYTKGTQDKIKLRTLQNVIAFRLFQLDHPSIQDEVLLQKLRLFGWYGVDNNKGKTADWCSDRIYFITEDKPTVNNPIVKSRLITKYNKMSIDKDFINKYEFKLIEVTEADRYKKDGYIIIKDSDPGEAFPIKIL